MHGRAMFYKFFFLDYLSLLLPNRISVETRLVISWVIIYRFCALLGLLHRIDPGWQD